MLGRVTRWSFPFVVGVVGGLALFAALLVPVLLVQYRRFGRLSVRRVVAVSAVCVYAVGLVAYTFLPLPASTRSCVGGGAGIQLVPFRFVRDITRETSGLGWLETLTSTVTLQVVLNVALFVPLGLLVRRFGGRSVPVTTLVGLLVSLAIELTQGTALWGLYACAYRVADVDDLLANTLGTLVGALLARRVLGGCPRRPSSNGVACGPPGSVRSSAGSAWSWTWRPSPSSPPWSPGPAASRGCWAPPPPGPWRTWRRPSLRWWQGWSPSWCRRSSGREPRSASAWSGCDRRGRTRPRSSDG